MLPVVRSNIC